MCIVCTPIDGQPYNSTLQLEHNNYGGVKLGYNLVDLPQIKLRAEGNSAIKARIKRGCSWE